jgi:hypothetical protein
LLLLLLLFSSTSSTNSSSSSSLMDSVRETERLIGGKISSNISSYDPRFLDNRLTDGGKAASLTRWSPLVLQENSWHSFLLAVESTLGP